MTHYEDFTINQGADVAFELHLVRQDTGAKKDLNNYTAEAQMNHSYDADSATAVLFTTSITDPAGGILTLLLTNQQTAALSHRTRYVYNAEISHLDSDSNNIIERVIEGKISVNPSV
jgi:hypothetical protein